MKLKRLFATLVATLGLSAATAASTMAAPPRHLEDMLYLQLKDGRVVIELRPDLAPQHVKRIKELVRKKFYDGLVFHRVIEGFMAQTGDPTGTGTSGSGQNLNAEFSTAKHLRGTLSMARAQSLNSADSQFFICFKPASFLDGQYTIFGQVIEGMEFVDNIKKGDANNNGSVTDPDKIITLRVAADVEKEEAAKKAEEAAPKIVPQTAPEAAPAATAQ